MTAPNEFEKTLISKVQKLPVEDGGGKQFQTRNAAKFRLPNFKKSKTWCKMNCKFVKSPKSEMSSVFRRPQIELLRYEVFENLTRATIFRNSTRNHAIIFPNKFIIFL